VESKIPGVNSKLWIFSKYITSVGEYFIADVMLE
jgi:hypothetical protein